MVASSRPLELAPDVSLFPHEGTWCLATSGQMHALRADHTAVERLVDALRTNTSTSDTPLAGTLERAGLLRPRRRVHGTVHIDDDGLRELLTPLLRDASVASIEITGAGVEPSTLDATLIVVGDNGRGPSGITARRPTESDTAPWLPWFQDGTERVVGPIVGPTPTGLDWQDVVRRRRSAAPSPQALDQLWDVQGRQNLIFAPRLDTATRAIAAGLAATQIVAFLTGRASPGLQQVVAADGSGWSDHRVLPVPTCA